MHDVKMPRFIKALVRLVRLIPFLNVLGRQKTIPLLLAAELSGRGTYSPIKWRDRSIAKCQHYLRKSRRKDWVESCVSRKLQTRSYWSLSGRGRRKSFATAEKQACKTSFLVSLTALCITPGLRISDYASNSARSGCRPQRKKAEVSF